MGEIAERYSKCRRRELLYSVTELDAAMEHLARMMDDGRIDEEEQEVLPDLREQFLEFRRHIDENLVILEKAARSGARAAAQARRG
ncbi:MAG: hypothetical protein RRY79_04940 [Clostridia bacterium]